VELKIKYSKKNWLIGRSPKLSTYNKLLLYNQIINPIWLYGIQLWGCASQCHIDKIQWFQNKVIRNIVNAPWYVRNRDLHKDLKLNYVDMEIKNVATKHHTNLFY